MTKKFMPKGQKALIVGAGTAGMSSVRPLEHRACVRRVREGVHLMTEGLVLNKDVRRLERRQVILLMKRSRTDLCGHRP